MLLYVTTKYVTKMQTRYMFSAPVICYLIVELIYCVMQAVKHYCTPIIVQWSNWKIQQNFENNTTNKSIYVQENTRDKEVMWLK